MEERELTYDLSELDRAADFVLRRATGPVWLFDAPMGAGKTTLIGAILRKLTGQPFAGSPTFALVHEYLSRDGEPVYHFDLYRLRSPDELADIGFEDYLAQGGLVLIEWPEKGAPYLPDRFTRIRLIPVSETVRRLQIENV
ncbi:MAG: tRNA (adenosine(37)-N6)-threonylcarbamoyltransferase complex ATPase subunit type 1 TsaE [Chlorobi bacterium]|nr:tRNA (adenosine(37)-N6)-threonylcarbamoyltransferase complex ATPase subunit type 1 TsaE [Chlorobiota bacterium]